MIKGIGVDIIEVARIRRLLERDNHFAERVFSESEIAYCQKKHRREQHYAARFSAKEAFLKALGTGFRGDIGWRDISVANDELGKPGIVLSGRARRRFSKLGLRRVHLTLTHTHDVAVACVVIE
jgi:holo-[acyl-carrier protein] synthase